MINQKTVFILGAGSSYPYGYPLGEQLRIEICERFPMDYQNWLENAPKIPELRRSEEEIKLMVQFAHDFVQKFDDSHTKSIDLFLAGNKDFERLGKLAIIFRILFAEHDSDFGHRSKIPDQDWYFWLFNQMRNEIVKQEDYSRFCENTISFVTFNYDRSLEHFLFTSLNNSFNAISYEEITKQMNAIKIVHVFRPIAPLEWQDRQRGIEYKRPINSIFVEALAQHLKIIYDESESPELKEAQGLIQEADRIFFLGFGYAPENVSILKLSEILNKQRIYGTALGLTNRERVEIESRLRSMTNGAKGSVVIADTDCLMLLRTYL